MKTKINLIEMLHVRGVAVCAAAGGAKRHQLPSDWMKGMWADLR